MDELGWPLCRVRVMVSWDVRWFVSGALYRLVARSWCRGAGESVGVSAAATLSQAAVV